MSAHPALLVMLPYKRREMADIATTIAEAVARSPSPERPLQVVGVAGALARMAAGRGRRIGLLYDGAVESRFMGYGTALAAEAPAFRVWMNTAQEAIAFAATPKDHASPDQETHVSVFPDVARDLQSNGLRSFAAPYAFTAPGEERRSAGEGKLYFASEVNISEQCFAKLADVDPSTVDLWSARCWDLANHVTSGASSLLAADQALARESEGKDRGWYFQGVWLLRNRVRYLLMKKIVETFPGRVVLRGSDWKPLGFDALPSRYHGSLRAAAYRQHRVSLDLLSKSSHFMLHQRVADIAAAGGGLVQFETGVPEPLWSPILTQRRASSADALMSVLDRLLTMREATLMEINAALQEDYARLRTQLGADFAEQLVAAIDGY